MISTRHRGRHWLARLLFSAILAALVLAAPIAPGHAQGSRIGKAPPERVPIVMVGDRLVNVAWHLGVVPEAMSIRGDFWTFGRTLAKTTTTILGCPNYIVKKHPEMVPQVLRETGIDTVLVEKTVPFDRIKPQRDPMKLLPVLAKAGVADELGTKIEVIDFTGDLDAAIRQVGAALDREEAAEKLVAKRAEELEAVLDLLPLQGPIPRVVVLDGTFMRETGKAFVRVHLPGAYTDDFLLAPLGAENVGAALAKEGEKGFAMLPRLDKLAEVQPDVIVMTGDSDAVQRKLAEAVKRNPGMVTAVPALARNAVLSLPAYYDSEVIEYPAVLGRWATAFASLWGV